VLRTTIRTPTPRTDWTDGAGVVQPDKNLAHIERDFRSMKARVDDG
jgi:hypothetical protein